MRQKAESFRDRGLNYIEQGRAKSKLEQELGHPICGFLVRGEPCSLSPGHPERLHSGDFL